MSRPTVDLRRLTCRCAVQIWMSSVIIRCRWPARAAPLCSGIFGLRIMRCVGKKRRDMHESRQKTTNNRVKHKTLVASLLRVKSSLHPMLHKSVINTNRDHLLPHSWFLPIQCITETCWDHFWGSFCPTRADIQFTVLHQPVSNRVSLLPGGWAEWGFVRMNQNGRRLEKHDSEL